MKKLSTKLLKKTIIERRNLLGLTQETLAKLTMINRTMLVRIEHGTYIPSIMQLEKLSEALDFDLTTLFVEEKENIDEIQEYDRLLSYKTCEAAFRDKYKREPMQSFCPYRICPLGAHIDHQRGIVHGIALNYGVHMAYGIKENGVIEIVSMNFPKRAQFHISSVAQTKQGDWADHLRGATLLLGRKYNLRYGMCAIIKGSLPIGGLSSSAAVIICFLKALCKLNKIELTDSEYISLAKEAENAYVGVSCGKLDQSCEVLCKKDNLLYLDCLTDKYENIEKPKNMKNFKIAIFFSGIERSLATSAYNNRVDECKAASFALSAYENKEGLKFSDAYLRQIDETIFEKHKDKLPLAWKKRCMHYYSEMKRVQEGTKYWKEGNIEEYGKLIFESGKSSIENYETTSEELKKLFEIMQNTKGIYGGRFSGAGFKGCTMALIDPKYEKQIKEKVEKEYLEAFPHLKGKYSFHICESASGVGGKK